MNIQDLKRNNALLEGHFLLSAGGHSDKYIQCERLNETPEARQMIISELKKIDFKSIFSDGIDVVIGGAYGAIKFPDRVGDVLYDLYNINTRSMYCERVPIVCTDGINKVVGSGDFKLRRGFEIKQGEKVLIVEDVTTTSKSIGEIAELVFNHNGEIIGIISIIDRRIYKYDGWWGENKKIPFISLMQINVNTWDAEKCPLCKQNISLVKPGSKK